MNAIYGATILVNSHFLTQRLPLDLSSLSKRTVNQTQRRQKVRGVRGLGGSRCGEKWAELWSWPSET